MTAELFLPEYVYHGTFLHNVSFFKQKPLDRTKWRTDSTHYLKDFGDGLYTNADLEQAQIFSKRKLRTTSDLEAKPAVIKFRVNPVKYPSDDILVFSGMSQEWSDYIYNHRMVKAEPCVHHHSIIIGPIADGNFKEIFQQFSRSRHQDVQANYNWFRTHITFNKLTNKSYTDKEIGTQIVFCNDQLNILHYESHYILEPYHRQERWKEV
ncbi:DUF3990 domain-containing protein [Paenibacillus sp. HWE-109]|uniref:DUF3990 domain-containing protein n=1 Tax=Paenibacillus sp. HWE-109 TaxID=1306526 RepID=UPI001EDE5AD1|nr:DUF3990 domain-containing protein [Paenibacillus sp. HWE-109]UKS26676.1 DUF3990 domain-containing protein [Paenibacillus sp. HWE-109]